MPLPVMVPGANISWTRRASPGLSSIIRILTGSIRLPAPSALQKTCQDHGWPDGLGFPEKTVRPRAIGPAAYPLGQESFPADRTSGRSPGTLSRGTTFPSPARVRPLSPVPAKDRGNRWSGGGRARQGRRHVSCTLFGCSRPLDKGGARRPSWRIQDSFLETGPAGAGSCGLWLQRRPWCSPAGSQALWEPKTSPGPARQVLRRGFHRPRT